MPNVEYRKSAGVIPLKLVNGQWQVLLLLHASGHYWGFPKGHYENGESSLQTAQRELKEETSLTILRHLKEDHHQETFRFEKGGKQIEKHVIYYLAEVVGEVKIDQHEIIDYRWVSFEEGAKLASFATNKALCLQVEQELIHVR